MLIDIMENLYREALRNSKTFEADASTFKTEWCYKSFELAKTEQLEESTAIALPSKANEVTERVKMLDSLHKFGNEEIKKTDRNALLFPGGEVHIKEKNGPETGIGESAELLNVEELTSNMTKLLGEDVMKLRFSGEAINKLQTKVMFISDTFNNNIEAHEDKTIGPLLSCFNPTVSLLFSRMINAMGIGADEFVLNALSTVKDDTEVDYFDTLKSEILFYKPELIITLGAQATNKLLKLKSRLKDIHGNFYQLDITDQLSGKHQFDVMPLFSPTLLQTAPNMKKTAWKDMQKAMTKLSL
jgi:uracil-DNA glycosylase family 4